MGIGPGRCRRGGVHLASRDHNSVGYRVLMNCLSLTEGQRGTGFLSDLILKRKSRNGFLADMGYVCSERRGFFCVCGSIV